jgi:VanZ family protein
MTRWRRAWYWAPPVIYAGVIFALSSLPHPEEQLPSFVMQLGDKTLHAVEYGALGVLCYRAFHFAAGPWWAKHAVLLAIIAASLYGVTDEVHQAFVPFREPSGWDVLADSVGAIVAVVTWRAVSNLKTKQAAAQPRYQA